MTDTGGHFEAVAIADNKRQDNAGVPVPMIAVVGPAVVIATIILSRSLDLVAGVNHPAVGCRDDCPRRVLGDNVEDGDEYGTLLVHRDNP